MKKILAKRIIQAVCLLFVTVSVMSLCVLKNGGDKAYAGYVGSIIEDGKIYEGSELSNIEWYFAKDAGVSLNATKQSIRFETTSVGKLFTSYTSVINDEDIDENLTVGFDITVSDVIKGNTFGFVFGSPKLRTELESKGTSYLWFDKGEGCINYGLTYYGDTKKEVIAKTEVEGNTASVDFVVSGKHRISLKINEKTVYESQNDDDLNQVGYLGFAQSGKESISSSEKTIVDICNLRIVNKYYARPENVNNSIAKFDNNEFNTEEWVLNSAWGVPNGGIFVQDEKLVFDGAGQGSMFASKFKYSNFVLKYDLSDVKSTPSMINGKLNCASLWQGVCFGIEGDDAAAIMGKRDNLLYFGADVDTSTGEFTGLTKLGFLYQNQYIKVFDLPEKFNLYSEGFDDVVNVKISVIDGELEVGLKLSGESAYTQVYSYTFENGYTPLGFVAIHGEGNQYVTPTEPFYRASYFTIDNIQLTNYDKNPNVISVGFKSNIVTPFLDYPYVDPWTDDYLIYKTLGRGTK